MLPSRDGRPASSRTFPLDIQLLIVDAIAITSPPDLPACALTCREWLTRARFGLYSSIDLHTWKQAVSFFNTISSSSDLGPLVRELTLTDIRLPFEGSSEVACHLVNLEVLTCRNFHWYQTSTSRQSSYAPFLSSFAKCEKLTSFALYNCQFRGWNDLIGPLTSLHRLRSFKVVESGCHAQPVGSVNDGQDASRWPHVTQLEVYSPSNPVDSILSLFGPSVHVLKISNHESFIGDTGDSEETYTDISRYTSLSALEITVKCFDLPIVARALSHLRSSKLEDLSVNVLCNPGMSDGELQGIVLEGMARTKVDDIVADHRLPSLRRLNWTIIHGPDAAFDDGFREAVEAQQKGDSWPELYEFVEWGV